MSSNTAFPWGIYLGDFYNKNENIPFFIPSTFGGVLISYNDEIENESNNLIENIALSISEFVQYGLVNYHIFDYSHKKRFDYLSKLSTYNLYHIYLNNKQAQEGFNLIEIESQTRHHERLSSNCPTVSIYNKNNQFPLLYHVIIINLDCYPEDNHNTKRLNEFLKSSFEAGCYIIAFGNNKTFKQQAERIQPFQNLFAIKNLKIDDGLFKSLLSEYQFNFININPIKIINNITSSLNDKNNIEYETNFLSIPVANTLNGMSDIYFEMGAKSGCYHAIITGGTGTGKSVFLNNIITTIAEKYTANEIRLNLMDYKEGIEFNQFKNHPNVENLFLSNNGKLTQKDKNAAFSLLEDFIHSGTSLSQKLRGHNCKNIDEYNRKNPNDLIPHRILIIDEIEQIYTNMTYNEKDKLNMLFIKILTQGRAWGIHLIICTQELLRNSDLPLARLKGQSQLRVTFKLQNNTEILNDDSIDIPKSLGKYEILINHDGGKKNAHQIGRAFPPKAIDAILNEIWNKRNPNECIRCNIIEYDISNNSDDIDQINENNSPNKYTRANDLFGTK